MKSRLFVVVMLLGVCWACHPECQWMCDNPICNPICTPVCQDPVCAVSCSSGSPDNCSTPRCEIVCPGDACEKDDCPTCETVCSQISCPPGHECAPLCEPTNCAWSCIAPPPSICPKPSCVLSCESPACMAVTSTSTKLSQNNLWMLLIVAALTIL